MDSGLGSCVVRALSALACGSVLLALSAYAQGGGSPQDEVQQLMVKLRAPASTAVGSRSITRNLSAAAGVSLARVRTMSGGIEVLRLPRPLSPTQANALIRRLAQDPSVEAVEPDRWVETFAVPDDPNFSLQWYLHDARSEIAAANLPGAWDVTTGTASVTIAILDTGWVPHVDLNTARIYPGYDFISDTFVANDGDGRDADPSDPGDWTSDGDAGTNSRCTSGAQNSSWHGTHVTGIVAASGNNGVGIAGVNWNSMIVPVRVLGKCGGFLSDVLDGLRWAAGIADPHLPANPHPARVLNLSLGAKTPCSPLVQNAVSDVLSAGAVIVAAAGNDAASAGGITPGNCAGVIAVSALDRDGNKAYYASTGPTVALSAPGGAQMYVNGSRGILSLFNTGTTVPAPSPDGDMYYFLQGTSMAAPQVTGVASLMFSINSGLTPEQIRHKLQATARAFPAGSTCSTATCGAGMLDAALALQSAANTVVPVAEAGTDQEVTGNDTVTLDGAASAASRPASIAQYSWAQLSGTPVTLSNANSANATFVAPADMGTLRFQLTVVDDGGLIGTDTLAVDVIAAAPGLANVAPTSAGAGGDSRCFIATAAYGSADATDVLSLRRFRDHYLLTNPIGRVLVKTYYALSPPFADVIRPYPLLRKLVRFGLAPYVAVARWTSGDPAPES